ncbi:DUF695 domain-containing protein [Cohnella candidum]|uniref:DUF695 domain-containing protein n=1 Tax=Cohnella candidum TaxID=2674991 RepID=A0A3G3JZ23_9BACL|nr:DUF695 domain-containing protein [Cohnella candidum]AYQ73402.1 DUF695 domain-containing protein [Cohnella candidum]
MSDNWDTYFTYIDRKPASFFLDLDPWEEGTNEKFVHLYRLSVVLKEPDNIGLTTNAEAEVLFAAEDSIHDLLDEHYLFVGRVTTEGRRNFYYYTDSEDVNLLQNLAARSLENYRYTFGRIEEKEPGAFYREFLYPNKANWHRLMNRHLVNKLNELGDTLEKRREVTHWIYFDSAESRRLFQEKVLKDGFRIVDQEQSNQRYSLCISRNDLVDLHAISGVTDVLVHAAEECGGDYDGWETKVIEDRKGWLHGLKKIFKSGE